MSRPTQRILIKFGMWYLMHTCILNAMDPQFSQTTMGYGISHNTIHIYKYNSKYYKDFTNNKSTLYIE
jgi:hypothetical protein